MKYKAVIFDMDGVIFDSERLSLACWEETAKKFGLTGIERYCDLSRGVNEAGSAKIFYSLYGENGLTYEECRAENSRLFHSRYDGGRLPMKKGVTELLSYLKEKGWIVGLASSTKEATVTQEIRDAGLMPYFDNLTCGDMLKKSKPEPDPDRAAGTEYGFAVCPWDDPDYTFNLWKYLLHVPAECQIRSDGALCISVSGRHAGFLSVEGKSAFGKAADGIGPDQ